MLSRKWIVGASTLVLVAVNLAVLLYRSRAAHDPATVATPTAQPVVARLAEPLNATLLDVSDKEVDFAAVVSLKPLCENKNKGIRAVYSVTFENRLEQVSDGKTSGVLAVQPIVSEDLIELDYAPGDTADSWRCVERSLSKKQGSPRETLINASGQVTYINAPSGQDHFNELGPRFLNKSIRKGDEWTQELAVDPAFNEGGKTIAKLRAVSTFKDQGQQIVRISRSYQYKVKTSLPPNLQDAVDKKDSPKGSTLVRVEELTDLFIETGITLRQETVKQVYVEDSPIAGLGGVLATAKTRRNLKELLN